MNKNGGVQMLRRSYGDVLHSPSSADGVGLVGRGRYGAAPFYKSTWREALDLGGLLQRASPPHPGAWIGYPGVSMIYLSPLQGKLDANLGVSWRIVLKWGLCGISIWSINPPS